MFTNKIHHVEDRIVSLQQPYIRPIQRGKAKAKTEFGVKIDASLSERIVDIERFDFSNFNESKDFEETLDHYFDIHGHYPDEVLADTLYRNRKNMLLCKDLDIAICGPRLGAKPKHVDAEQRRKDTDAENRRGAIERRFAFLKGSVGLDLVNTRTVESLAVKIDQAVVLSNVLTYLRVFGIPIFISAKDSVQTYHFRYKFTTSIENMVA
jgi:hypothetical protein